ncbi:MAG TPA: sigma-70 family RNA polymerase sigma factor [Ruminiclostridium sp.]|nr:sigma-70 family RNA polymerase sigma factor [Ruminiclostridium sp.]
MSKEHAEQLYNEYLDYVYRIALFVTKSKTSAEDVTQETFIQLFRKYHTYDQTKPIEPWIYKITLTASNYYIQEISGKTYMFCQWKSGDYVFRGMEPRYYVLEKVDSNDYSDYKPAAQEDKIDYAFENNPQMLGNWKAVDFVKEMDQFKPDTKSSPEELFLTDIKVMDDGKISASTTSGQYLGENDFWTKDLIINKGAKTASKCIIKEIDGSTYMFFQWKSGDYTYRGMTPSYYVLKKIN